MDGVLALVTVYPLRTDEIVDGLCERMLSALSVGEVMLITRLMEPAMIVMLMDDAGTPRAEASAAMKEAWLKLEASPARVIV